MRLSFTLLAIFVSCFVFGQETIKVIDAKSKKPLACAHIIITDAAGNISGLVATPEGEFYLENRTHQIAVSYLGYQNFKGTLKSNQKTIALVAIHFNVSQVVVSGQYAPISKTQSVQKIELLTAKELAKKGIQDLASALEGSIAIRSSNRSIVGNSISMQGLSGDNVKLMVDGVPVVGSLKDNIDLSQINISNADKIEIIEGPLAVNYGTNALGGVINIITKTQQKNKLSLRLATQAESVGQYNIEGLLGLKKDKNTIQLSAGRNFFDGYSAIDTSRFKQWKQKEQLFAGVLLNRKIKGLRLIYKSDAFNEYTLSRGERKPPYYVTAIDERYQTIRLNNSFHLKGVVKEYYLNMVGSHSYYYRKRNRYYKDLTSLATNLTPAIDDHDTTSYHQYMTRISVSPFKKQEQLTYQVGVDANHQIAKGKRIKGFEKQQTDLALFSSVQYHPIEKLIIQPAFRVAKNSAFKHPFIPSLHLKYAVGKSSNLRLSGGKGFRAPTIKQLYLEYFHSADLHVLGNENLLPEQSINMAASLTHSIHTDNLVWIIESSIYYNSINALIQRIQISDFQWQYTNVGKYKTKGVELKNKWVMNASHLSLNCGLIGSLTLADSSIDAFKYTPVFAVNFKHENKGESLLIDYEYNGSMANYYLNDVGNIAESSMEAYHLMNIAVQKKYLDNKFTVTLGIKNVFNVNDIKLIGTIYGVSSQKDADYLSVAKGSNLFINLTYEI